MKGSAIDKLEMDYRHLHNIPSIHENILQGSQIKRPQSKFQETHITAYYDLKNELCVSGKAELPRF
jgi:hypothetical protein